MEDYVVTVKKGTDLDQFYSDMETPGGCDCIPEREVECCNRRPISRNTNYILSAEEAETLKNDSRVLDVVPQRVIDSVVIKPLWTQTSTDWDKSTSISSTNKNWALYRCITGSQSSNWGSNGTFDQSGTITTTSSGKNVDVVIVDGHLDESHPEFAVNEDGTGGSRVIEYNWYRHTSELGLGANGTYVYPSGSSLLNGDDNHGMHVAGTVCGNTQGWARDANIYSISPYASNPNTLAANYIFDYIRAWHNSKPINLLTGRKNPTILNNSWGSSYSIPRSGITVNYRGTDYSSPTNTALISYGIREFDTNNVYVNAYLTSYIVDLEDSVDDGIIFVGAAGNEYTKIDVEGGIDFNNYVRYSGSNYYYHRGSSNSSGSRTGVGGQRLSVCVGALSSLVNESKAVFSNSGPRVDIYAPGVNIISCLHTSGGGVTVVNDPRNSSYKLGKYQGTSMASPQVCGVLACVLEQYPNMNQADVHEYLNQHSTKNQITSTNGGYSDNTDLQGSDNEYLFYKKERLEDGVSVPRYSYGSRRANENGIKYPRTSMRITKTV
jgi:hypothetical protein